MKEVAQRDAHCSRFWPPSRMPGWLRELFGIVAPWRGDSNWVFGLLGRNSDFRFANQLVAIKSEHGASKILFSNLECHPLAIESLGNHTGNVTASKRIEDSIPLIC